MTNKAISPVIGIILMVAVTLALVGLVAFTVLNLSDETGNSDVPDSSVKATQTSGGLQVTVLKDSNVDEFVVQGPDGKEVSLDSSTGSVETIGDGAGKYNVIAITNDGSRQVVTSTDIEEGTDAAAARTVTFTQEGSVSINPPISNAIVKSTEDGVTMDVTQTDSSGEFTIGASEDSNITVVVKGFTFTTGGSNKVLYASAQKRSDKSSSLNFNFEESSAYNVNINGEDLLISYNSDSSVKEIATAEQLQAINKITNGLSFDYKISNDINFDDSSNINQFDPLGSESDPFTGSISGNNHTIKNLKISQSSKNNTGLISYSDGSTIIKNLELKNPDITGNDSTGVVIGNSTSGTIENINIVNGRLEGGEKVGGIIGEGDSDIYNSTYNSDICINGGSYVGGFIGNGSGDIYDSNLDVCVEATGNNIGGLIGQSFDGSSIYNTTVDGEINTSGYYVGGMIGDVLGAGDVEDVTYEGSVTSNGDQLGGIFGSGNEFDYTNVSVTGNIDGGGEGYEVGGIAGTSNDGNFTDIKVNVDINSSDSYVGGLVGDVFGSGNVENVTYEGSLTSNGDQLGGIFGSGNDFNYTNVSVTGNIDGSGGGYEVGGIAGTNDNGNFTDITVNTDINSSDDYVGGLVGDVYGSGNVENVTYEGSVTSNGDQLGGIFGSGNEFNYTNVSVTGNIDGSGGDGYEVGGIAGTSNDGNFTDIKVNVDINSSDDYVGGLVGDVFGSGNVENVTYEGSLTSNGDQLGGIFGSGSNFNYTNVSVTGNIDGSGGGYEVGGIAGTNDNGDFTDIKVNVDINSSDDYVGGLVGDVFGGGNVENVTYEGSVTSSGRQLGGIFGSGNDFNYTNVSVTGNIDGSGDGYEVGGIAGNSNDGNFTDITVNTDINSSDDYVGGLVGDLFGNGQISDVEVNGDVNSNGKYVGGLVGSSDGMYYNNVSASGVVESDNDYTGGLFGDIRDGDISNSKFVGNLESSGDYVGGIAGELKIHRNNINGSYVNVDYIKSDGDYVGGIAGKFWTTSGNTNTIENTYVKADNIEGSSKVGGLVGSNGMKVRNSYVVSDVSSIVGSSSVGNLIGQNGLDATNTFVGSNGTLEDSYWDNSKSSISGSIGKQDGDSSPDGSNSGGNSITNGDILRLTTSEMKGNSASTSMEALDFNFYWKTQTSDYPKIRSKKTKPVTLSGQVSINPSIPNAKLIAFDSSGSEIAITRSNNNGEYEFKRKGIDKVRASINGVEPTELSDTTAINGPLYATETKQKTSDTLDLDFNSGSMTRLTADINGRNRDIIFDKTPSGELMISNIYQLQAIKYHNLNEDYKLISNISASSTSSWNGGSGFEPIGSTSAFTGTLDGNGYTINNLYINRPDKDGVAFISENQGTIKNLEIDNADVTGNIDVEILVSYNSAGTVEDSTSDGVWEATKQVPMILKIDPKKGATPDDQFNLRSGVFDEYRIEGENVTNNNCDSFEEDCIVDLSSDSTTKIKIYSDEMALDWYDYSYLGTTTDAEAILSVEQWGNIQWTSFEEAFANAHNMNINANDEPELNRVYSMESAFYNASSMNSDLSSWDTSDITNMNSVFQRADSFNGDISSWDTSGVTDMSYMFEDASSFNQDISSWCVRYVNSQPTSFDRNAGFDGNTDKQPDWGTTNNCS